MSTEQQWDYSFDVVVVGSGNGGMTAALCTYEMGTRDVLVIEKSDQYGGSSSISGGGVWIPGNRYAKAAGAEDSFDKAKTYLRQLITEEEVPEYQLDAFLTNGPKMVDFLHERTRVCYQTLEHYPDYYTNLDGAMAGHRSMEPATFDASELGEEWRRLRRTHPMMHIGGRIGITQVEAAVFVGQQPGWMKMAGKLVLDYILDFSWRLRDKFHRRLATGCAGVARLRASMLDRDMPLWLNTGMTQLIQEDGKVVGLEMEREGKTLRIQARKGVVLAAGGFEHNQQMREAYLPKPTDHQWSAGTLDNTGDAHQEGLRLGAKMHRMDEAWWCNTISPPGEEIPRLSIMEKSYPGSIVVNPAGERFSNESQNYMAFQLETFEKHTEENPTYPTWQVFDADFRSKYFVGPIYTSQLMPDFLVPWKRYEQENFMAKADTIAELAAKISVDAEGLEKTVGRMNEFACKGVDDDLHRGESAYDRYYGDPRMEPNPCLGPVAKAPFYAVRVDPGDFGTQGGMVITANAEVVHEDGSVIEGLYACGNCSAPTLPCYPGPGATLGPSMTFGYQAAKAITGYQD
ncbi:3-oxosteroid 1-dehydrogenase [Halioglobus japonicus]|uniref:3-oxosteroid 1-dehydrogenase n=1 Tax=Halioglobus japonicus TaxID=930805 RepID=A0AAP8MHQ2_9GAMM|nr:FAD-dependent oxidoreductase [Halioglobus japonicus]AQA19361.1 3-oxosteroid 1-dehydrogenase [Halioglobus japonicus]PLW87589.1 FAD-binding protein [Halioglobus japonicus]GHD07660.1 3-oxosteroid 1-dehydrogenase [Halioglobus japonicus]